MIRIIAILLLTCNFAVAQISQQTIVDEITTNLPTNNQQLISAELLRNTLNQMTSAIFQNQGLSGFTITGTPTIGQAIIATSSSTASWQNIGGLVTSVTNNDGSLIINPNTGNIIGLLNTNHLNTWTQIQNFNAGATSLTLALSDNSTNIATTAFVLGHTGETAISGIPLVGWAPLATSSTTAVWGPPPGGLSIASFDGINDGVTDNHDAFVAAVAAIRATSSGCGLIWFGPGTWFTSSAYDVPSCISVMGAGRGVTFLKGPPSGQPTPLGYTLIAYATFNGTGNHGISGVTTYPINMPTEGSLTVTTTTASDASHFTVGGVIAVSGTLHATNFWYPYWATEVVSADPATGIITLAKTLPFGGSDISLVQNIIDRPHDITISNLTLMGSGVGAMQANTTLNLTFDNIEVMGTTATGTNNHAYFSIAGSVNSRVTNSKFINYVDCLGCFYANYSNLVISNGQLSVDGGTQDSVFDGIAITDPSNNGTSASGIVVVSDANHNKIINSHITNVPSGLSGINVGQSNDGIEGANIFCNNTVTGIDTTVTSMIVTSSVGNVICSSVFDTASIAVRLSTNSTGTLIFGNNSINVTGSQIYVADSTSGIVNPVLPQNFSNFSTTTTPNVGFGTIQTNNGSPTSITNFTGGAQGQVITLIVADANTTLTQGLTMFLRGQANYSPPSGTKMVFQLQSSGQWQELSRSQNTTSQEQFIRGINAGASNFSSSILGASSSIIGWQNGAPSTDTTMCRLAAGIVEFGSGSACGATATIAAAAIRNTGTPPTGNTGTCSTGVTVAGGSTTGTWTSTSICALAGTIILTAMPTQTNGYVCSMTDRTTAGIVIEETATSATSATFTVRSLPTGTVATVANDIIQYSCIGY